MSDGLKIGLIIIGVLLLLVLGTTGWVIKGYNNVITMDEQVKAQWAQVENQLKGAMT